MILIFASSLYENDPQIDLLITTLKSESLEFVLINPLDYESIKNIKISIYNGVVNFYYKDKIVDINTVYIARQIRSDCIIKFPILCDCTTLYRQKVEYFISETYALLSDKKWFPGNNIAIKNGDLKINLYKIAFEVGLSPPHSTINSFDCPNVNLYRKVLGYPFSISYSIEEQEEIAVTLFNKKENFQDGYGLPWQWQSYIEPLTHLRCVCVGDKIWCFYAEENQLNKKSLREAQEDTDIIWQNYILPKKHKTSLKSLMARLNLSFACPEFIIDTNGKYQFIDLNPCGDWYGFGTDEENVEIAHEIVANLRD